MYNQYFATRPRISITMPSSKRIYFDGGVYVTDKQDEIEFLNEQIKQGHPMIYVKKGSETLTAEQLDPVAALKNKIIADYEAQKNKQQDSGRDMGTTSNESTGMSTSKSIGSITVGSKSK